MRFQIIQKHWKLIIEIQSPEKKIRMKLLAKVIIFENNIILVIISYFYYNVKFFS